MSSPTPPRGAAAPATASAAPTRAPERWSVFAVIGFVCAWLLAPAGLACSIVALVRTADDRMLRGRGLAIAGIVVSTVVMLAAIAVIAYFVWLGLMFAPYDMQLRAG